MRNWRRDFAPNYRQEAITTFKTLLYSARTLFLTSLSFIIPTFNEEHNIGDTIDRIVEITGKDWMREIIVVDNGSKDDTVKIATEKGARVLNYPDVFISSLRNRGAHASTAEILIFIDGDVSVTPQWGTELNGAVSQLLKNPMQIIGSVCGVAEQAGWLERNWFDPALRRKPPGYVNSAHMIVHRSLFEALGGFDENIETGEDVDFSERAKHRGARIVLNPRLAVIHKDFPKNIRAFFKREKWHARGDYSSIHKLKYSKPAMVSVFLLLALPFSVILSLMAKQIWMITLYLGLFVAVCLMASIHRFGISGFSWIKGGTIYAIYFTARGISFVEVMYFRIRRLIE